MSTQDDIIQLFEDTINVTNMAFEGTPFRFEYDSTLSVVVNNTWLVFGGTYLYDMFDAISSYDSKILDVILVYNLVNQASGDQLSGLATFPEEFLESGGGSIMTYNSLRGGGGDGIENAGFVLTHEIGHWLSLAHTVSSVTISFHFCH